MTGTITGFTSTGIDDNADATAITIDSSENVGIGVVPEAWHNDYRNLAVGGTGVLWSQKAVGTGKAMGVGQNVYYDGSNKYITTDEASRYYQANGVHTFEVAASGSADSAITWTEAMTIDNSGAVTKPLQPAFSVQPSSDQTNIALTTWTDVNFGTEVFDVGSNFASNTFTAPVAGKYGLGFNLRLENCDTAADFLYARITTSNRSYQTIRSLKLSSDPEYWNANLFVVADMDASDTAVVVVYQGGGTAQMDIQDSQSHFYGYLLG
jgi:hypothetical protein